MNSTDLVLRVIDAIDEAGVAYMLVGSYRLLNESQASK
jgi:hypothetical protein